MPKNYEHTKRFDLNIRGLNVIVYVSDLAVRITLRKSPSEQDVVIVQGGRDGLGVNSTLSFIGTADHDANIAVAEAARAAAAFVLREPGFSPKEVRYLRAVEQMRNPEPAQPNQP